MSLHALYAHLGLLEPGTAAVDRDGDVWCVWPDGHVGCGKPTLSGDMVTATALFGPFAVLATGLSLQDCDGIASHSKVADRAKARAYALERARLPPEVGPLGPELGVESIDGPNGLRTLAGPRVLAVGLKVRLTHNPGSVVGEVVDGPDAVGRWQVKFPHIPFPLWLEDDLEVVE